MKRTSPEFNSIPLQTEDSGLTPSASFYHRNDCRLCHSNHLSLVFSLAPTPPANDFVKEEDLDKPQKSFPLDIFFCENCAHVQLLDVVDPTLLFRNYVYVSGTSPVFVRHFNDYANEMMQRF